MVLLTLSLIEVVLPYSLVLLNAADLESHFLLLIYKINFYYLQNQFLLMIYKIDLTADFYLMLYNESRSTIFIFFLKFKISKASGFTTGMYDFNSLWFPLSPLQIVSF